MARRGKAAEFYAATFPDSHVGQARQAASDYPGGEQGSELTVEFTVLGQAFVGLNGGPAFTPNEAVSFPVVTEGQAETDRFWNPIIENGGSESQCGWCKDRWGFFWQIVPRALIAALKDPDRAAAASDGRDDDHEPDRHCSDWGCKSGLGGSLTPMVTASVQREQGYLKD